MIDWFYANKEWLFSGIAVVVPLAIISWLVARKCSAQKQIQKSGRNSINIQVGKNLNIGNARLENKNGEE